MDAKRKVQSAECRVQSEKQKTWLCVFAMFAAVILVGCGAGKPGGISRIALLAPFEGRYWEVGYNAYYAAKLALADYGKNDIEFLAVDDGGSAEDASARARALAGDPLVKAVILMGYAAADAQTQAAFGDMPILIVGDWDAIPESPHSFLLTNPQIEPLITVPESKHDITDAAQIQGKVMGGDGLALEQFPLLNPQAQQVTVVSSGSLPDVDFTERYVNSAQFTPQPGLLATLAYDAANIVIQAIDTTPNRNLSDTLKNGTYTGINGSIHFTDGYWADAPIHYFAYDADDELTAVDRPVK